jgi:hypothetical protein
MNRRINHAIYIIITIELHRTIKQLHIKQLLYEIIIQLDLSAWYHYMHLDLSAWDHCASRCIWIDHMQETGLTSLHKLLIINMPYFLYQDLIIMHTYTCSQEQDDSIQSTKLQSYFTFLSSWSILSRIERILPIQLEEERSIYLIQSSSSLSTCAADRLLTLTLGEVAIGADIEVAIGVVATRKATTTIR